MGRILVVDDTEFWRNIVSAALRAKGHGVTTAGGAAEALGILRRQRVDLIILDVDMPRIQGLSFLQQIRQDARLRNLPVIMLTGDMVKEHVLLAKKLGAVDYLLKARFSPPELLDRVQKRLESQAAPASPAPQSPPDGAPAAGGEEPIPRLLTREQSLERAEQALAGRTMSGIIAQVIAAASSPRIGLADLATLIGRDAVLTARVLHAANRGANITARGTICTLPDAVRIVGCATIGNIAASIGVFDAMPLPESDGFDPIRSWQHAIGVATICGKLASAESGSPAYLVGLCHDLGDVLLRTHFGDEYREVLEIQKSRAEPVHEVQRQALGISRGELADFILQRLGLPQCICRPIALFHKAMRTRAGVTDRLAKTLQLADAYATGMLLAASEHDLLRPFTRAECHSATGIADPPRPDDDQIRGEIYTMTGVYADLSRVELERLVNPIYPRTTARVLVARDRALSSFDPVTAALQSMADVTAKDALPTAGQVKDQDGLVVLAPSASSTGFTATDVAESASDGLPVLWLTGTRDKSQGPGQAQPSAAQWPITFSRLAMFVQQLSAAGVEA